MPEIGCGVARIGQRIASMCREWVGSDVSVNMLRHAKAACAAASVTNVDFFHLNGSDLTGIPDASFDVVYSHRRLHPDGSRAAGAGAGRGHAGHRRNGAEVRCARGR